MFSEVELLTRRTNGASDHFQFFLRFPNGQTSAFEQLLGSHVEWPTFIPNLTISSQNKRNVNRKLVTLLCRFSSFSWHRPWMDIRCTPAMEAGVATSAWTVQDLLTMADA
jgi:hypothetical protein